MYHAYDSLPDALKQRIAGSMLKHDGTYNSGGYVRQGVTAVDDPVTSPGAYHPLVCTHPETSRRALYLGRRRNAYIPGLPLAESEALLDELWSIATREEFTWRNEWQVGDVVLVGQPLHHASPRPVRSRLAPRFCTGRRSRVRPASRRDRREVMRLGKLGAPRVVLALLCAMYYLCSWTA